MSSDITTFEAQIENLNEDIADLEDALTSMQAEKDDLEDNCEELTVALSEARATISVLIGMLDDINAIVTEGIEAHK